MNFPFLFSICAFFGTTSVVCGLCWRKSPVYRAAALMSLFVMVALLYCVWAPQANADGVQETGIPACPLGMDGVRFFVGNRHLATVCMAKAELERAQYISGPDKGMVACQTIVVMGKR